MDWNWSVQDNVQNPGREYEFGGEYGPYMFKELATGSDNRTTIYFTMSSWNPYVSLLMKTELLVTNSPVITRPPTDQQVMAGQSATFELTVSAVGSLSYNWARNGAVDCRRHQPDPGASQRESRRQWRPVPLPRDQLHRRGDQQPRLPDRGRRPTKRPRPKS